VVGDNLERVVATLRRAAERSDAVIVTGGLGPTPDDLTREAVAVCVGRPLLRDERLARLVSDVFDRMGRRMPLENLKQADLPRGAIPIEPAGTAPGFYLEHGSTLFVALPGVPWEMKAMLDGTVLPLLRRRSGLGAIASKEILVVGLGESLTHERIADIVAAQHNPTIAYLAGGGVVRVRITAKADSPGEAQALIHPVEQAVRARLGDAAVHAQGATLAEALGRMLIERGATIAAAESITGGLIGAALTSYAGSSAYFLGSLVCYSDGAKQGVAGIPLEILQGPGAVSEDAARALADTARRRFGADLGIAATGVAGPSEQEGKPPGTVYVGAALRARTEARFVRGYGDRQNVRSFAMTAALDLGRRALMRW
jgi:nicotinamide-nucleotide amidase